MGTACRAWIEVGISSSRDSSEVGYENKDSDYLLNYMSILGCNSVSLQLQLQEVNNTYMYTL